MIHCTLCNINIVTKHFYKHCNSTFHIEKEKMKLKCEICDKSYKNIGSYKTHINEYHMKKDTKIKKLKYGSKINNKIAVRNQENKINNNMNNNLSIDDKTYVVDSINKSIYDCADIVVNEVVSTKTEVINTKKDIEKIEKKVDKALTKASSIVRFLMEHFKDVPPLLKIDEDTWNN